MSHVRQQIRDIAAATLTAASITDIGTKVYTSRAKAHSDLPDLTLFTADDTVSEDVEVKGDYRFRDVILTAEIRAKLAADIDDTLDDYCAAVESAFMENKRLSATYTPDEGEPYTVTLLNADIEYMNTTTEFDQEGETPYGLATMTWLCRYCIDRNDPEAAVV